MDDSGNAGFGPQHRPGRPGPRRTGPQLLACAATTLAGLAVVAVGAFVLGREAAARWGLFGCVGHVEMADAGCFLVLVGLGVIGIAAWGSRRRAGMISFVITLFAGPFFGAWLNGAWHGMVEAPRYRAYRATRDFGGELRRHAWHGGAFTTQPADLEHHLEQVADDPLSPYWCGGARLPYRVKVIAGAQGPLLEPAGELPGTFLYAASADGQRFWLTLVAADGTVSRNVDGVIVSEQGRLVGGLPE